MPGLKYFLQERVLDFFNMSFSKSGCLHLFRKILLRWVLRLQPPRLCHWVRLICFWHLFFTFLVVLVNKPWKELD